MRISVRTIVSLVFAVLAGVIAFWLMPEPLPEWSRAEFMDEVRAGHVSSIVIKEQEVIIGESTTRGAFRTAFRKAEDARLSAELRALGIEIRVEGWTPLGF